MTSYNNPHERDPMPGRSYAIEPVQALLDDVDPEGQLPPCGLRRLVLGSGAIGAVADTVSELLEEGEGADANRPSVLLMVDPTPILRGGDDVKDLVEQQLRARFDVRRAVLDDGQPELHVVDHVLDQAAEASQSVDVVVAVGGGTISDIAKVAVQRARKDGRRPLLVTVQTAASVDGFTDDVSVVLRQGVKRTVPSCWPDGVVADAETVAGAPAAMNRAGFGEMTSMLVAPADWRLASLVGADSTFSAGPIRLLGRVGADIGSWSAGVRHGDPLAVEALTRALALRGIATGVAGTTAVLSGVEHLVSHMLDLYSAENHLPMGLHGAQVGVGTVVAAAAWEMFFERVAAGEQPPKLDGRTLNLDEARTRVESAFSGVDPTGRVGEECWRDYSAKLQTVQRMRPRVDSVLEDRTVHEGQLRALVRPSRTIAADLRAAGAAATFEELDPHVGPEIARWAVTNCALMRNRFTIVDMLTFLGWWTTADVDEVLERAHRAASFSDEKAG